MCQSSQVTCTGLAISKIPTIAFPTYDVMCKRKQGFIIRVNGELNGLTGNWFRVTHLSAANDRPSTTIRIFTTDQISPFLCRSITGTVPSQFNNLPIRKGNRCAQPGHLIVITKREVQLVT